MKLQQVTWQLRSCRLRSQINLRFEWQQGLGTGRGGSGSAPPPSLQCPCPVPCCPVPSLAAPHPPVFSLAAPHPSVPSFASPHPPIPSLSAPYPPVPFLAVPWGIKNNSSEVLQIELYFMHISLLPVGESCSKEMPTQISFSTICNIVTQDYA